MKTPPTLLAMLVCGLLGAEEGNDQYAHEESPSERFGIERGRITELPKSITYELLDDNRHRYEIAGLYPFGEGRDPKEFESHCSSFFLPEMEAEFAVTDSSLTITSTLPISYDWLARAIQGLGESSGIMPTWFELKARDLPTSKYFERGLYTLTRLDQDFPPGLAWFRLYSDTEFRFPFSPFVYESLGMLIVAPTTATTPAPPRIAIRVLDEDGRVIWKVDNPIKGKVKLAVGDRNEDNFHELYLEVFDVWGSRKTTRYVLEPRSEQASAGQPEKRRVSIDSPE